MLMSKKFVKQVAEQCEPLYQMGESNVKMYWENKPSKEEAIEYFGRRMINERINCIELSRRVSQLPNDTPPDEMFLLSKQAHDEAKHFWFVKEILEDLSGSPVNVEETHKSIKATQRWPLYAELLSQFECAEDPIALAMYQFIAEGLAHRNWVAQSKCAPTKMIAEKYAEIAKDEKFHAQIGRRQLEKLIVDEKSMAHAKELSQEILDLLWSFASADKDRCVKSMVSLHTAH